MEPVVNIAHSFADADDWDIQQCLAMTADERMQAARVIKDRMYPEAEDIRDCLRDGSRQPTFRKMLRNSSGCFIITQSDFYLSEGKP